jgi:transcriptional regulator with XRE-family HTH domain
MGISEAPVPATLGRRIAECRERLGLTQSEFAQRAGISVTFLSEVENDKRKPGTDVILQIADALGVSIDYLIKGETEPPRSRTPLVIPSELAEAAEERRWSLGEATDTLKAHLLVVARRSRDSVNRQDRVLTKEEWFDLHDRLFRP